MQINRYDFHQMTSHVFRLWLDHATAKSSIKSLLEFRIWKCEYSSEYSSKDGRWQMTDDSDRN